MQVKTISESDMFPLLPCQHRENLEVNCPEDIPGTLMIRIEEDQAADGKPKDHSSVEVPPRVDDQHLSLPSRTPTIRVIQNPGTVW